MAEIQDWQARFESSFGPQAPDLIRGDPESFGISLTSLDLIGGSTIHMSPVGVMAIVGANNAGKSTVLREVVDEISRQPGQPVPTRLLLHALDLRRRGEAKDAVAWVGDHSTFVVDPQQVSFQTGRGARLFPDNIRHAWQQSDAAIGELAQVAIHYSHAQDRFSFGGSAEMRAAITDPASHPLHQLQDSRELLQQLSDIVEDVFGTRLTLDTLGRTIQLRVGNVDIQAPPVDNISTEYLEAMTALPSLDQQGDGMRGFMGQLLPLVTSSFKIIALDEPEAFLHPPQAYGLGQQLGRLAVVGQIQVIVATHDRNLLAGLLDSGVDVSVVRLQRSGATTGARQLDAAKVTELWRDPVLKYTNVLDGLFHRAVVLGEAEADCAYYAAAIDVAPEGDSAGRDLLFVPTGGKDGMARVARSLCAVGVPVVATADLDLLNDESKVRGLVQAIDGVWTDELHGLWRRATNDLRARREPVKVSDVMMALHGVLCGHETEHFTPELQGQVKAQLRTKGSRWEPMKEYGLAAFKGQARHALDALLDALDSIGIVLVKPGELERLAPEVAISKGPEWLPAALTEGSHKNHETQAHVTRIRAAAGRA